jgi:hypothetical protein
MDIAHILQTELPQEEREVLSEDRERWKTMGAGSHLEDWLAYAPGIRIRRQLAMKINHTNEPKGRGYNETYGQLLRLDGFDVKDGRLMTSLTAVAWLDDRTEILRKILDTLSPGERSRLNSPITARQRVEKVMKARSEGEEEKKLRVSPVTLLKQKNTEQAHKIADLEEKLAAAEQRDGSLFDLTKDNAADIATIVVQTISPTKARTIASKIIELLKQAKPAG